MKRINAAFVGVFIYLMTYPTIVAAHSSGRSHGHGGGHGHGHGHGGGQPFAVPEIDASTGALALAALGAALVLAWEINRRRKIA